MIRLVINKHQGQTLHDLLNVSQTCCLFRQGCVERSGCQQCTSVAGEEEEEDQGTAHIKEREEATDEEGEKGATESLRTEGEEEPGTPHRGRYAPALQIMGGAQASLSLHVLSAAARL